MSKITKNKKYFKNTDEMLDYLGSLQSDDEDVDKVYLEPPEDGLVSDEDSGEEDGGGTMENLVKKQLQAPCEVVCNTNDDIANLIDGVLQNSFRNIRTDLLDVSPSTSGLRLPDIFEKQLKENKSNKTPEKIAIQNVNRKRQNINKEPGNRAKIKRM